jgi:hypothetical protein
VESDCWQSDCNGCFQVRNHADKKGTDNGQDCGIRMALRKQTESVIFHYRYCHCSIRTVNLQSISQNSGACR